MKKLAAALILLNLFTIFGFADTTRNVEEKEDGSADVLYTDKDGKEVAKEHYDTKAALTGKTGSIPDGLVKEYFEDGKTMSETNYKNNIKEGPAKYFYKSGKVFSEFTYKNDKTDGVVKTYYENGKINTERTIKENIPQGESKMYYENGNLRISGTWKDGSRDGFYREYYETGKMSNEEIYKDGVFVEAKAFDEKGNSTPVYNCLVKRIENKDKYVDFMRLRYSFTETPAYNPYGDGKEQKEMKKAFIDEKYEETLRIAKGILEKKYVDLEAHYYCIMVYEKLKKEEEKSAHEEILKGLFDSIYYSGDGMTPETAIVVIEAKEEQMLLDMTGLKADKQNLLKVKEEDIDEIEIKNKETKEVKKIYFNVTKPMKWMRGNLKKDKK